MRAGEDSFRSAEMFWYGEYSLDDTTTRQDRPDRRTRRPMMLPPAAGGSGACPGAAFWQTSAPNSSGYLREHDAHQRSRRCWCRTAPSWSTVANARVTRSFATAAKSPATLCRPARCLQVPIRPVFAAAPHGCWHGDYRERRGQPSMPSRIPRCVGYAEAIAPAV